MKKVFGVIVAFAPLFLAAQDGTMPISGIKAHSDNGQVFITWDESPVPDGSTFNVYAGELPVTNENLKTAKRLAHHIEPHSARNWWRDSTSFAKDTQPATPVGFIIEKGGKPLDPSRGLFVHTIDEENIKLACYAVTVSSPDGKEDYRAVPGTNSLQSPVAQSLKPVEAIWQGSGAEPGKGSKGESLTLNLHARGGGMKFSGEDVYLVFGSSAHGWREGLPFVFKVSRSPGMLVVSPSNRFFAGRPVNESWDKRDHVPAIENFWFGCNEFIYDPAMMKDGRIVNYSENILLWLKDWALRKYSIDPGRAFLQGTSMGGCGSVSNAIHHPSEYAAACAMVPIVSYTNPKSGSARRLEPFCGKGLSLLCSDGLPLSERMNGEAVVRKSKETLPFLFLLHGRQDASIPWENNPGFYKALDESRQGYMAYWDDGKHDTAGVDAPEDVKAWKGGQWLSKFSLAQSFPAFSNCSTNRNPGNGDKSNGDTVGWMNRGMSWEGIEDDSSHYAITIKTSYPGVKYPVFVDVTPRRLQKFKPSPGESLPVSLQGRGAGRVLVDNQGLFTVKQVSIPSGEGVRIVVSKGK